MAEIFVTDPLNALVEILAGVAPLAEIVYVAVGEHIIEGAVAFLKHTAGLVALHLEIPAEIHRGNVGGDNLGHSLLHNIHFHQVGTGEKRVAESP